MRPPLMVKNSAFGLARRSARAAPPTGKCRARAWLRCLLLCAWAALMFADLAYGQNLSGDPVTRSVSKAVAWLQNIFLVGGPVYGSARALWALQHNQEVKKHIGFGAGSLGIGLLIDTARSWMS